MKQKISNRTNIMKSSYQLLVLTTALFYVSELSAVVTKPPIPPLTNNEERFVSDIARGSLLDRDAENENFIFFTPQNSPWRAQAQIIEMKGLLFDSIFLNVEMQHSDGGLTQTFQRTQTAVAGGGPFSHFDDDMELPHGNNGIDRFTFSVFGQSETIDGVEVITEYNFQYAAEHIITITEDLVLMNQTIDTTQVFQATNSITAGPAFRIMPPGDVTFRAGNFIRLLDGFTAQNGSQFRAHIDGSVSTAPVLSPHVGTEAMAMSATATQLPDNISSSTNFEGLGSLNIVSFTVYENAEDETIDGWQVYGRRVRVEFRGRVWKSDNFDRGQPNGTIPFGSGRPE